MNVSAIETMRSQYLQFSRIKENISDGIKMNNIDSINECVNMLADFLRSIYHTQQLVSLLIM